MEDSAVERVRFLLTPLGVLDISSLPTSNCRLSPSTIRSACVLARGEARWYSARRTQDGTRSAPSAQRPIARSTSRSDTPLLAVSSFVPVRGVGEGRFERVEEVRRLKGSGRRVEASDLDRTERSDPTASSFFNLDGLSVRSTAEGGSTLEERSIGRVREIVRDLTGLAGAGRPTGLVDVRNPPGRDGREGDALGVVWLCELKGGRWEGV